MSKVLVKAQVDVQEAQSLVQAQEMIMSVFSSVAYIRDLFSEESYEEWKVAGMLSKRLKKDVCPQANQFLAWIEGGCFDAVRKKYLASVILGIFEDPKKPTEMLETYTLSIEYPSSASHQVLWASSSQKVDMKLSAFSRKDASWCDRKISGGCESSFQKEMAGLIRSLCVLTQTLGPLPAKRYLTMQLTYYDELTPKGYEPPGFIPQDFDINYIFAQQATLKHSFGFAQSQHHRIGVSLETSAAEPQGDTPVAAPNTTEAIVPTAQAPTTSRAEATEDIGSTQTPPKESEAALIKGIQSIKVATVPGPRQDGPGDRQSTQNIRCSCEDQDCDLDMIQCDGCGNWQHTPCVGYCSNRDKRIPKDNYTCYHCRHGPTNRRVLAFLKDLSRYRRVVAVLYTDGFKSITELGQRLSCNIKRARYYVCKLQEEGLLEKKGEGTKVTYAPSTGPKVKEKLNYYFGLDPEKMNGFPEHNKRRAAQPLLPVEEKAAAVSVSVKKRKSETSIKIDA